MKIDLSILRLPTPPAKPKARLAGETHSFKELKPEKIQSGQRYNKLADNAARLRGSSIDEKFQEFLAGEARQREVLRRQLRAESYKSQFLLNCMGAE